MHSKLTIACCSTLTVIVLHTCLHIEVLNARNGYLLPRTLPATGNPKWRVAATQPLLDSLERTIALERMTTHIAQHPGEPEPEIEKFSGAPYTDAEQALIDTELTRNRLNLELRAWVSGMGLLQYLLAPAALLLSLVLIRRTETRIMRYAPVACATSNTIAICLMIYRGYFTSLGW